MSRVAIDRKTGQRYTVDDMNTRNPQRTLEIMVESKRAFWEDEGVEVTPLDAVEILEGEQKRLIGEREDLETQKEKFIRERDAERARLKAMTDAFEDEKKKFELEKAEFNKKKKK